MSEPITRVFDLLKHNLANFPQEEFINGKIRGEWKTYSTATVCNTVDHFSRGLIRMGMGKGSRIAVMSANRPEWNMTDFGISQIGAYQIPIYPTAAEHDIKFILENAEVQLIFVNDQNLYHKLKPVVDLVNPAIQVYTFDEVEGARNWREIIADGEQHPEIDLEPYRAAVSADDILTLIYTAGTTGTPKGVMLTHNNLIQNFQNCNVLLPPGVQKGLSFLPLSHVYERMVVYLYIYKGASVYYAESIETIVADIQFVKPDIFGTVPRLLEKVYDKILEKGKQLTGMKKRIFFWSLAVAEQYEIDHGFFYGIKLSIARKLVFSKWAEALGGNIKVIISGGAALNARLARIFWAATMPVFEGYGLTETSPVIAVNYPGHTMFGTVGIPLNGVEIKIAEDGEVLARGHAIMKGYYKRPDLTSENIDAEGWFHTGDIGEFLNGKFLKITDRKKEMFKTAGGKYIAPQMLENKYKESTFIEQIMICGENRKFPAALIVPNFTVLQSWCEANGLGTANRQEMTSHPQVMEKFSQELQHGGVDLGKWEQVKRFALLNKEWSIEGGEFTPKLSLKRKIILEKNKDLIEKLYRDAESYKA